MQCSTHINTNTHYYETSWRCGLSFLKWIHKKIYLQWAVRKECNRRDKERIISRLPKLANNYLRTDYLTWTWRERELNTRISVAIGFSEHKCYSNNRSKGRTSSDRNGKKIIPRILRVSAGCRRAASHIWESVMGQHSKWSFSLRFSD
jgi:hypothetical protein